MGAVNIDNQGIAGIEAHMDGQDVALLQNLGLARERTLAPVKLTIDMRVQHAMHEQLLDALSRYKAIACGGRACWTSRRAKSWRLSRCPISIRTIPRRCLNPGWTGRTSGSTASRPAIYELGSTFKTVTMAGGARQRARCDLTDTFDARYGIRFGRFTIDDFHGKHRVLTRAGNLQILIQCRHDPGHAAAGQGEFPRLPDPHRLRRPAAVRTAGDDALERFPSISPMSVRRRRPSGTACRSRPLHMARAVAGFVNDGMYAAADALSSAAWRRRDALARRVISPETSDENPLSHAAQCARRIGHAHEQCIARRLPARRQDRHGRKGRRRPLFVNQVPHVFASAFPLDDPRYAMVITRR